MACKFSLNGEGGVMHVEFVYNARAVHYAVFEVLICMQEWAHDRKQSRNAGTLTHMKSNMKCTIWSIVSAHMSWTKHFSLFVRCAHASLPAK